ncbi:hypothetical protein F4775DRAFT_592778 [Biscogniauxia sp. FL1348]|nr:hypothetical protein F4775DRAFT_592778 [Biscogniauxia sp. FL1348]
MLVPDYSGCSPAEKEALLNGPALAPPPNVTPNFKNPPNGSDFSIGITCLCIVVSLLLVLARLYVSWFVSRKLYLTDVLLLVSFAFHIAYDSIILESIVRVGYLMHQWDIDLRDFIYMLRSFTICPTMYTVSIVFIKFAIVLELLDIFNPHRVRNLFYWCSYVIMAVNFLFYTAAVIVSNMACKPYAKNWDPFVRGTCAYDPTKLYVTSGTINFIVDIMIFLLPQKIIWRLQMSTQRKLCVAGIFAIGIFGLVSAGFRLYSIVQFTTAPDKLFAFTVLGLWTTAEMTCGIIVFCVPSVPRAFVTLGLPKIISSLKPWACARAGKPKGSSTENSWSSLSNNERRPRQYLKLEGRGRGPGLVPLQDLEPTLGSALKSPRSGHPDPIQEYPGILRTTVITSTSYEDTGHVTPDAQFFCQHPWASTPSVTGSERGYLGATAVSGGVPL